MSESFVKSVSQSVPANLSPTGEETFADRQIKTYLRESISPSSSSPDWNSIPQNTPSPGVKERLKRFYCTICTNKSYCKRQRVVNHMYRCHNGVNVFTCYICDKEFEVVSALQIHLTTCHPDLSCGVCSKKFSSKEEWLEHQNLFHLNTSRHDQTIMSDTESCPENVDDGKKANRKKIRKSSKGKRKNRISCKVCNKSFKTENTLHLHRRKYHSNESETYTYKRVEIFKTNEICESPERLGEREGSVDQADGNFGCRLCGRSFQVQSNLNAHMILCHSYLRCSTCGDLLPHVTAESEHKEKVHPELSLTCDFCPKTFQTKETTQSHMTNFHLGLRCHICKQLFIGKGNLLKHVSSCIRAVVRIYQCHLCDKQYTDCTSLSAHIKSCHTSERFHCRICSMVFESLADLSVHERSCNVLSSCTICSKKFETNAALSRHVTKCHLNCNICSESFKSESALSVHIRVVHLGENPFRCVRCCKSFSSSNVLKVHVNMVHGGDSITKGKTTKGSIKKMYRCRTCRKSFSQYSCLKMHIRAHNFVKCGICNQRFANEKNTIEHIKVFHVAISDKGNIKQYLVKCDSSCALSKGESVSIASQDNSSSGGKDTTVSRDENCRPQVRSDSPDVCTASANFLKTVVCVDGQDEGYISPRLLQSTSQQMPDKPHTEYMQTDNGKHPSETYDILVSFLTDEAMKTGTSPPRCEELISSAVGSHQASVTDGVHPDTAIGVTRTDLQHCLNEVISQDSHQQNGNVFLDADQSLQHDNIQTSQSQKEPVSLVTRQSCNVSRMVDDCPGFPTQKHTEPDVYSFLRNNDPNGDVDMRLMEPQRQQPALSSQLSAPRLASRPDGSTAIDIQRSATSQASDEHPPRCLSSTNDQCSNTVAKCILWEEKVHDEDIYVMEAGNHENRTIDFTYACNPGINNLQVMGPAVSLDDRLETISPEHYSGDAAVPSCHSDQQGRTEQSVQKASQSHGHLAADHFNEHSSSHEPISKTVEVGNSLKSQSCIHTMSPSQVPEFDSMSHIGQYAVNCMKSNGDSQTPNPGFSIKVSPVETGSIHCDAQKGIVNHDVNIINVVSGKSCLIPDVTDDSPMPLTTVTGVVNTTSLDYVNTSCLTMDCVDSEIEGSRKPVNINLLIVEPDTFVSPREPTVSPIHGKGETTNVTAKVNIVELFGDEHSFVDDVKTSKIQNKMVTQSQHTQSKEHDQMKLVHFDYQSNFKKFCENATRLVISVSEDDTTSRNQCSPSSSCYISECFASPEHLTNIGTSNTSPTHPNKVTSSEQHTDPLKYSQGGSISSRDDLSSKRKSSRSVIDETVYYPPMQSCLVGCHASLQSFEHQSTRKDCLRTDDESSTRSTSVQRSSNTPTHRSSKYVVEDGCSKETEPSDENSVSVPYTDHYSSDVFPSRINCEKCSPEMECCSDECVPADWKDEPSSKSLQIPSNVHERSPRPCTVGRPSNAHVSEKRPMASASSRQISVRGEIHNKEDACLLPESKSLEAVDTVKDSVIGIEEALGLAQSISNNENQTNQITFPRSQVVSNTSPHTSSQMVNMTIGLQANKMCGLDPFESHQEHVSTSNSQIINGFSSTNELYPYGFSSKERALVSNFPGETIWNGNDCESEVHPILNIDQVRSSRGAQQNGKTGTVPRVSPAPIHNPLQVLSDNIPDRYQTRPQESSRSHVMSLSNLQQIQTTSAPDAMNGHKVCLTLPHESSQSSKDGLLPNECPPVHGLQEVQSITAPHRHHSSLQVLSKVEVLGILSKSKVGQVMERLPTPRSRIQLTCCSCHESFPSGPALDKHKQTQHSLRCTQCGETFSKMMDLIDHYESCT